MSTKRHREQALLFVGALFSSNQVYSRVLQLLAAEYGPVLFESDSIPWEHTGYYADELGDAIKRRFIFFGRVIDAAALPDIKIHTDSIEADHLREGKRQINLDPGYLTEAKVILASTKNYSHRIYLGKGIYAEQEYIFSKGSYRPLAHSYADYLKPSYVENFVRARNCFRGLMHSGKATVQEPGGSEITKESEA